jgi:hypothetical protein
MAIQNNLYFRVLVDPLDSTGASEISNADRVNIIGGGAVDEQQIILENSNHCYSTTNRRVITQGWSLGAVTSDTTNNYLAKETGTAALVTVVETPATVGADRQSVVAVVQYQGQAQVEVLTPALVSLASQTLTSVAAPAVNNVTLSWSTTQQVIIRIKIAGTTSPSAADGFLWGYRLLESQTSL